MPRPNHCHCNIGQLISLFMNLVIHLELDSELSEAGLGFSIYSSKTNYIIKNN